MPELAAHLERVAREAKGGAEMTREEHLQWCKKRALEYADRGDIAQAITSMGSDLEKHPETKGHRGTELGVMLLMSGSLQTIDDARRFINGFN